MQKSDGMNYAPQGKAAPVVEKGEFVFAATALEHGHIFGMVNGLQEAGGVCKYVYDADPNKVKDAKRIDVISYSEVLKRGLAVMDSTATAMSMDNDIPVVVFALKDPDNIRRVLLGEHIGSIVGKDE